MMCHIVLQQTMMCHVVLQQPNPGSSDKPPKRPRCLRGCKDRLSWKGERYSL